MKSVLLCVATEKGYEVLKAAVSQSGQTTIHVCTFDETNVAISFSDEIREFAASRGISLVGWADFKRAPEAFLESESIAGILCVGWRYLIPENVVQRLGGNVVVAHDSLLPKLRGFAPLVTALIAGENKTGVTFLRAGRGVDDGDILWQQSIDIFPGDTIADLIQRTIPLYVRGAEMFLRDELQQGTPQDEAQATYSIWRDEDDYWIDWSQDSATIERTIRALGAPYLGARCRLEEQTVVIHEAAAIKDIDFAIRQAGKVWALDEKGRPTIVCGRGMLRVLGATSAGQSIFPLRSLRVRFQ